MEKETLVNNLYLLYTTELGKDRIRKNLQLEVDAVTYCKDVILDSKCEVIRKGKNYYCRRNDVVVTVNVYSYTIITAHKK